MKHQSIDAPSTSAAATERTVHVMALKALFAAWRAASVYDENNTAYQTRRAELAQALDVALMSGGELAIVYQNDYIFVNGTRLNYDREFSFGRQFAQRMAELGLGGLTIRQVASTDQIDRALFALAQADRRIADPFKALQSSWSALNLTGVDIAPLSAHNALHHGKNQGNTESGKQRRRKRASALFQHSETVVRDCWERVRDRGSFDATSVQRLVHQLIDEVAHDEDVLLEFATMKDFDEYTFFHSVNVAMYSLAVGMRLGLGRTVLSELGMAALFHDLGKVKLPQDLITKPNDFNEDDWRQIQRHPMLGALTIASMRPIDGASGAAIAAAFEHHLKMDLSGYPKLSRPREIHLYSRIITVCDSFDAMTSGRVYQKVRIQPDEAVRRLLYNGRDWYDPLVLKAFVHVVGIFPVGSLVRLSDQTIAVVTRNETDDVYCPDVLVIRDADGKKIMRELSLHGEDAGNTENIPFIDTVLDAATEDIDIHDYIANVEVFDDLVDDAMEAEIAAEA